MPQKYHQEDWLREEYVDGRRSTVDISNECGVSAQTIRRWLDEYDIPRRNQSEAQIKEKKKVHDEEWLREQYIDERRSMRDIGDEVGMTASGVKKWINRFDITTRKAHEFHLYEPASFFTGKNGYEYVSSKHDYDVHSTTIHQLVAIANGANPSKVFSNGRYHVHHENRIYWDNRPENLTLKSSVRHQHDHNSPNPVPDEYELNTDTQTLLAQLRNKVAEWEGRDNSTVNMCANELDALLRNA